MEVLQGNTTSGKLTATERTNPSLIIWTKRPDGMAVRMLPPTSTVQKAM